MSHFILGDASGDIKLYREYIESGVDLTTGIQARHQTSNMHNKNIVSRQRDEAKTYFSSRVGTNNLDYISSEAISIMEMELGLSVI